MSIVRTDPNLWWNSGRLVKGAAKKLEASPNLKKTLYFASNSDDIGGATQQFADVLEKEAPPGLHWHYEKMPEEKHSTIYHPAALRAFRAVFKPEKKD